MTTISWHDAIVWCNAYSELSGRKPCYSYKDVILRDSTEAVACDLAACDWTANGFRLPTEAEWEYAARRLKGGGFQRDDLPSGLASADDSRSAVAWTEETGTAVVGSTGSRFPVSGESTASPGSGTANAAGLFDMSGNVMEYCWDWNASYTVEDAGTRSAGARIGTERVSRGGSWSSFTPFILAGDRYAYDPNEAYAYLGFRIACSTGK